MLTSAKHKLCTFSLVAYHDPVSICDIVWMKKSLILMGLNSKASGFAYFFWTDSQL